MIEVDLKVPPDSVFGMHGGCLRLTITKLARAQQFKDVAFVRGMTKASSHPIRWPYPGGSGNIKNLPTGFNLIAMCLPAAQTVAKFFPEMNAAVLYVRRECKYLIFERADRGDGYCVSLR